MLVGHAGAVMDAVVDRSSRLQRSSSTVPRDERAIKPEARDDQPLVEDLHEEDLLLERVEVE